MKWLPFKRKTYPEDDLPMRNPQEEIDDFHGVSFVKGYKVGGGFLHRLCRKWRAFVIALHMTTCLFVLIMFDLQPYCDYIFYSLAGSTTYLFILNILFLSVLLWRDPGIQPRKSRSRQYSDLVYYIKNRTSSATVVRPIMFFGNKTLGNFCTSCHHFKHPKTIHCEKCDKCVIGFTHHCKLIDSCVGSRNFFVYFCLSHNAFLFYGYISMICQGTLIQKMFFEYGPTHQFWLRRVPFCFWIMSVTFITCFTLSLFQVFLQPFTSLYTSVYLEATIEENKVERQSESGGTINQERSPSTWKIYRCLIRRLRSPISPSLLKKSNENLIYSVNEISQDV